MKTQKMYMFSLNYGIEEVDALIGDNKISLIYGDKQGELYIDNEKILHDEGENINTVYECSLISYGIDLPEIAWVSASLDDIKFYIDYMFMSYNTMSGLL